MIFYVLGGAAIGFIAGALIGEAEGGDYNMAPAIYAPFGGMIGAIAGAVISVIADHIHIGVS